MKSRPERAFLTNLGATEVAISLIAAPKFLKLKKKLPDKLQEELDNQITTLIDEPETGELKKGDLTGVRVLKFKYHSQQILLAYQYDREEETIYLLAVGSHENFYRDLKKYLH